MAMSFGFAAQIRNGRRSDILTPEAARPKPELLYPEATKAESTRPAGSGDLARIQQDTLTLVLS
jgi:hypothetical protein